MAVYLIFLIKTSKYFFANLQGKALPLHALQLIVVGRQSWIDANELRQQTSLADVFPHIGGVDGDVLPRELESSEGPHFKSPLHLCLEPRDSQVQLDRIHLAGDYIMACDDGAHYRTEGAGVRVQPGYRSITRGNEALKKVLNERRFRCIHTVSIRNNVEPQNVLSEQ